MLFQISAYLQVMRLQVTESLASGSNIRPTSQLWRVSTGWSRCERILFQKSAECQFGAAQGFELARRAGFSAKIPAAGDERAPRFATRGIFAATRMPCGGDQHQVGAESCASVRHSVGTINHTGQFNRAKTPSTMVDA